jgi:pSer/pThr/pTyr-binding forkhead associated (FHA) protein
VTPSGESTLPRGQRPRAVESTVPRQADRTEPRRRAPQAQDDSTRPRSTGASDDQGVAIGLEFDTNRRIRVTGDIVVGRAPDASLGAPVVIDDPDRSVSKNHFRVGVDKKDRMWVEDLGSTNGTVLIGADGSEVELAVGQRHGVVAGCEIRFGDRRARVMRQ